jgi:hypothetical protein
MDNPQHYQPLSHALNPHLLAKPQSNSTTFSMYEPTTNIASSSNNPGEDDDGGDGDEDDEEEGLVEEQLHDNHNESNTVQTDQSAGCVHINGTHVLN